MTTLPAHPNLVTAANRPRVKTLDKLDAIRGFAAIYVMLSHLSSNHLHLQRSWLGQPFRFAQEGVLLFFLLSGFVIYYSWDLNSGRKSFSTFFYKRFRRIYPIFFLALLLAFVISGGKYPFHFWNLAGNLFMLQGFEADHGFRAVPFMGNGPLWSLSYEWWFYMLFFLLYRYFSVRLQRAAVMVLGLIGVAGEYFVPNIFFSIVASFPIWWCGVEFAREYIQTGNFTLRRQRWTIGSLFVIGLAYAAVSRAWTHSGGVLNVIEYPSERSSLSCRNRLNLPFFRLEADPVRWIRRHDRSIQGVCRNLLCNLCLSLSDYLQSHLAHKNAPARGRGPSYRIGAHTGVFCGTGLSAVSGAVHGLGLDETSSHPRYRETFSLSQRDVLPASCS